mmetsp:Transcript_24982/g.61922  ORF Transcript_24982/g.61922 Transcript_24982/m.61922 type:complete len:296 (-) Transcript_24982:190-1077(-)
MAGAREPLPAGLVFERVLLVAAESQRVILLCNDPHGSGGQAIVDASKLLWTEAELRALVEGDNALATVHRNDKFSKHDGPALTGVSLKLISPANEVDIAKYTKQEFVIVRETPSVYEKATRPFVEALPAKQLGWVYAILDRQKEMESLLWEDAHCMLLPDTKWDRLDVSALYIQAILKDRTLRSVRDLRGQHVPMLRELRDGALACIQDKFEVPAEKVRVYFHYLPSFWHMHIHFSVLGCPTVGGGANVGKAILLEDVIMWLEKDPAYFETTALTITVGKHDKLYASLKSVGVVH